MLENTGNSRCRSLPMQVSIMAMRPCERSTKHWKEMIIFPSGVAKCGCSQPNCCTNSAVSSGSSMPISSSQPLTSTIRAMSTSPIFQCLMCSAAIRPPDSVATADQVGGTFSHHHHRCICIATDDTRKYGGVHYPQAADAVHTQLRIDHCPCVHAHAAGADGMMGGSCGATQVGNERGIIEGRRTGLRLVGLVARQRRRRAQTPGQPQAAQHGRNVRRILEQAGLDTRWIADIGAGKRDLAAAARVQVHHAHGE